jgi:hypothetical protein
MTAEPAPTPDELRLAKLLWSVMSPAEKMAVPWGECPSCREQCTYGQIVKRGHYRGHCWYCAYRARTKISTIHISARKRRARANRTCEHCAAVFTPPRSDGRFCSNACRQAAYRQRTKGIPA